MYQFYNTHNRRCCSFKASHFCKSRRYIYICMYLDNRPVIESIIGTIWLVTEVGQLSRWPAIKPGSNELVIEIVSITGLFWHRLSKPIMGCFNNCLAGYRCWTTHFTFLFPLGKFPSSGGRISVCQVRWSWHNRRGPSLARRFSQRFDRFPVTQKRQSL